MISKRKILVKVEGCAVLIKTRTTTRLDECTDRNYLRGKKMEGKFLKENKNDIIPAKAIKVASLRISLSSLDSDLQNI